MCRMECGAISYSGRKANFYQVTLRPIPKVGTHLDVRCWSTSHRSMSQSDFPPNMVKSWFTPATWGIDMLLVRYCTKVAVGGL
jgi:hypothetical protein